MHGSAAPVTGTPLTRRQIREAERAREAARVAAAEAANPVTEVDEPIATEPRTAATEATHTEPARTEPLLTERDATPTVTMRRLPVTRRDLRPVDAAAPKRRGRSVAPRMVVLGVLGALTIAAPVAGLPAHDDSAAAVAAAPVSTQTSVLDVLDAGVAAAALTAPAPTTLLASPTAAGRAEVAAASRASERSDLPAETLAGASGAVAAVVEPEPEPEPEPVAAAEPAPEPAPAPAPTVVMPMDAGTYRNTSGYGYRSFPFAGMHTGTDLAAPLDTPIRSVADGVVTYVGPGKAGRSSMLVTIEHEIDGQWVETWYNHMFANDIYVQLGQTVKAGEVIAGVGNNGRSTGPHLHFEVHVDKNLTTVEPLAWLAARGAVSAG